MSDLEREHATLLAFVAGVSRIPLGTPAGVNAQQHHAKRLRIVRRAARHIIEHQFGDAEKAIAELLVEGRVELRDGQITLAEEPPPAALGALKNGGSDAGLD